jgi:hypothetical protein
LRSSAIRESLQVCISAGVASRTVIGVVPSQIGVPVRESNNDSRKSRFSMLKNDTWSQSAFSE